MPKEKAKEKPGRSKAEKHEAKGDAHAAKGKHDKALKEYLKALDLNPDNAALYDKLIAARDAAPGEWGAEEFADSVGWAMAKQEHEHPTIKQVHARLSPEWASAVALAIDILHDPDEPRQRAKIEQLAAMGEIATRAMIGLLLDLKNAPAQEEKE